MGLLSSAVLLSSNRLLTVIFLSSAFLSAESSIVRASVSVVVVDDRVASLDAVTLSIASLTAFLFISLIVLSVSSSFELSIR